MSSIPLLDLKAQFAPLREEIYAAIREDIMSRQSMVSTMISGHRTFKDDRAE